MPLRCRGPNQPRSVARTPCRRPAPRSASLANGRADLARSAAQNAHHALLGQIGGSPVVAVVAGVVGLPPPRVPRLTPRPTGRRRARTWGVTLDDVTHSRALATSSAQAAGTDHRLRPCVFDPGGRSRASYAAALRRIHPGWPTVHLGQARWTPRRPRRTPCREPPTGPGSRRTSPAFPHAVDVWEIGNEVNGELDRATGRRRGEDPGRLPGRDRCREADRADPLLQPRLRRGCRTPDVRLGPHAAACDAEEQAHLRPDLLLPERLPQLLAEPGPLAAGVRPAPRTVPTLAASASARPAPPGDPSRRPQRAALLHRYDRVRVRGDRFVGGGFWWSFAEDGASPRRPVWKALAADMRAAR